MVRRDRCGGSARRCEDGALEAVEVTARRVRVARPELVARRDRRVRDRNGHRLADAETQRAVGDRRRVQLPNDGVRVADDDNPRGYYDMAYNDPYYYGKVGFTFKF